MAETRHSPEHQFARGRQRHRTYDVFDGRLGDVKLCPVSGGGGSGAAVVVVTDGRLEFGPCEPIFCGEFDGQRCKRVLVKTIGE